MSQNNIPLPSPEEIKKIQWAMIRAKRNKLLSKTDWTQLADTPPNIKAFKVYRQKLREIPQTYSNPDEVVWPEMPKL
ncbi:phage tail assembly chaperone [Endozoicomonas sp. SM1973]|uniref:Phage tail assembly chaperone n=1 Tax=Spartinivicinus marinus TaxID=2994442 RepID=A0A853HT41_9GAMM|nr:tail fiber assembly protein [Spartinivicinus marinus]MCX4026629.1 tail fiber assembly protein [Spartinivicinus marinus]NYZ64463.1 phage tail assembly chaperone [Spartinivicinus marinus]